MKLFYKRTCISCTTYSTMLYLMLCKDKREVENTLFVIDNGSMATELASAVPHKKSYIYSSDSSFTLKDLKAKFIVFLSAGWHILFSKIFAVDLMWGISKYILFHKYTLLEDGPGVFLRAQNSTQEMCLDRSHKGFLWNIKALIFHGPILGRPMGRHSLCVDRIITDPNDAYSALVRGKHYTLVNIESLWNEKSDDYRNWILSIFSITKEMVDKWKKYETIILTQPFIHDCGISETEFVNGYKDTIERYKDSGILIKQHPRENFDWSKYYPWIEILDTKLPMQFLCAIGVKPKRVMTMSSSAISSFGKDTEVIFTGHYSCPNVMKKLGNGMWYKNKDNQ